MIPLHVVTAMTRPPGAHAKRARAKRDSSQGTRWSVSNATRGDSMRRREVELRAHTRGGPEEARLGLEHPRLPFP